MNFTRVLLAALLATTAFGQSNDRNRMPPVGITISQSDREELAAGVAAFGKDIEALRRNTNAAELLPEVEIFHKAVDWALRYDEFYRSNEVGIARALIDQGRERAKAFAEGRSPWTSATGLVVRAYRSRIDQSVQPYGLVVPPNFHPMDPRPFRLDVWLHGRDTQLTELKFINDRQRSYGEFAPSNTFVLHPYGRFCNAFKFAGEIDVLEAIEHVRRSYRFAIDEDKITIRGFSMGGGGAWHLAAHYPRFWAAAAPGAGFAETAEFTRIFSREPKPTWYDQALWHLYDATDYAGNFFNLPVIAYSGELDRQKQAADIMARAMEREGLTLTHLIGPKTEHKYEPLTKIELEEKFSKLVVERRSMFPPRIRFTTYTTRYNSNYWVTVNELEKHWERADVDAEYLADEVLVRVKTTNISALTLRPPKGRHGPLIVPKNMLIDDSRFGGRILTMGRSDVSFVKKGAKWAIATNNDKALRKRHGLQGPIDDAFMDSFIIVRPTGEPMHTKAAEWIEAELAHATNEWRAQFRGDAVVKSDVDITNDDIARNHLVLFGDRRSNKVLARIARKLPVQWRDGSIRLAGKTFPSDQFVPVLIYPNPLNPSRYVVLNSGFTFCDYGRGNNALQIPKLPDYAVLDMSVSREARYPKGVALAGFFDERWR